MKVLIYTHSFAPKVGGVETYVKVLAQGLARRFSGVSGLGGADRPNEAGTVTVVTATPATSSDDSDFGLTIVRHPSTQDLWKLLGDADVLHLAGPVLLPLIIGVLRRVPIMIEHHGYQVICPNGLLLDERTKTICPGHFRARRYSECLSCGAVSKGWLRSVLAILLTFSRRVMCGRVAAHVAVSTHVVRRIGLPRCRVIYHGLPDPRAGSREDHPTPQGHLPLSIAYVGRLVREKGLRVLLEAVQRLKAEAGAFQVKLVGDGPEREELEALSKALGVNDRVSFTGSLHGSALRAAIAETEVLVMPSIWEETAGLSAIEHMMRGRAVIVADIGGLGEIVDGAGLKFAVGDVDGLVDAIQRLLRDRGVAAELGRLARDRAVLLFSEERMVDEHVTVYRQLSGGHRGRLLWNR